MAKVLNCDIVVNEFEFQSRYYIHFRARTQNWVRETAWLIRPIFHLVGQWEA